MVSVVRASHVVGSSNRLTTLQQRFRFEGPGASAAAIGDVLLGAPLVGDRSVFGDRPGREGSPTDTSRTLHGFSPAPGFRFDVTLAKLAEGIFLVQFSQPDRNTPYLQGDLVWTVGDDEGGATLDEQVNTERAFEVAREPLTGPRPSLRRWLFFRVGHKQVMSAATNNIAKLLSR